MTIRVTAPVPEPEAGDRVNQGALPIADQVSVPSPIVLMLSVWAAGLPPPCVAVKVRLVGLVLIAGLTESVGAEGGESNCANSGISEASLFIVRPPPPRFSEVEELREPAAANGMVRVGAVLVAMDPVAVAGDGVTLMVARGMVTLTLLLSDDGSLD